METMMKEVSSEKAEVMATEEEVKNTFSGKNPYRMLTSYTFVDFVKFNEEKLAKTFYSVARSIPSTMNCCDYRALISDMYARTIDRNFYQLKDCKSIGYDMLYNNSLRISLKTMQTRLFQRNKLRGGGLTTPRPIILKNKLVSGKNSLDVDLYGDYLLAVSSYYDKATEEYVISFGVVSFGIVQKYIPTNSVNDQVKVAIPDSDWAFISKTYRINDPKNVEQEERRNNVLNTGLDNIYFEMQRI